MPAATAALVPAAVGRLPSEPGVYRFRDVHGRALYIGRTGNLRGRVRSYWGGLRDRRHLRRMVPRIATVEAVSCDSEHEAAWLERNLLEHHKPYWNRARGGQEVPVYLRLDQRRDSATLTVAHRVDGPSRHFGPYLGGAKVRLAASALHRVLSLTYAADGLTGSDADMARARGVSAADRRGLVELAVAVLRADPAAVSHVRADLARRRDEAAMKLLFELAGRIQTELEAIDWVTAPQRATDPSAPDADVHGFADGTLVSFEFRDGRLRTWSQRACAQTSADRLVAATPPSWAEFARRNAELAARLG